MSFDEVVAAEHAATGRGLATAKERNDGGAAGSFAAFARSGSGGGRGKSGGQLRVTINENARRSSVFAASAGAVRTAAEGGKARGVAEAGAPRAAARAGGSSGGRGTCTGTRSGKSGSGGGGSCGGSGSRDGSGGSGSLALAVTVPLAAPPSVPLSAAELRAARLRALGL